MFYLLSKIYWVIASPILVLILAALVGAILSRTRFGRFGQFMAIVASALLLIMAVPPFSALLVSPLENRFPEPTGDRPAPYGIVILGGAMNAGVDPDRGQATFLEGERVIEAALLAKRFPHARILFTGASPTSFSSEDGVTDEAEDVRDLLVALGVDPARITLESQSRNTEQNARFSAALVHPAPDQEWLLVTSAFHMPRAVGVFEKAGFTVVPWPVAFRTREPGWNGVVWQTDPGRNIRLAEIALREWIGLAAYRMAGKIDHLFPGPPDATR